MIYAKHCSLKGSEERAMKRGILNERIALTEEAVKGKLWKTITRWIGVSLTGLSLVDTAAESLGLLDGLSCLVVLRGPPLAAEVLQEFMATTLVGG
jgi:hypothetical protein